MARDLTAGMVTALRSNVIRPVLLVHLDIASDPLTAWTGPGIFAPTGTPDAALNGLTFINAAPISEISEITEDQGIGGPVTITAAGHDIDESLLRQVVRDARQWRGRKAYLWLGLMNTDEATAIVSPTRIKTGVMSAMRVGREGDTANVTVTIDRDLGRARGAPFRWIDHAQLFPADTWSTFVIELANKPEGLTDYILNRPGNGDDDWRGQGDASHDR